MAATSFQIQTRSERSRIPANSTTGIWTGIASAGTITTHCFRKSDVSYSLVHPPLGSRTQGDCSRLYYGNRYY